MIMKTIVVSVFCLIFVKTTLSQCIGSAFIPEAYGIAPAGIPPVGIPFGNLPSGLPTAFSSQLTMNYPMLPAPSFSILSDDLVVEGIVSVAGSLPFLGTVSLGGTVPVAGEGSVLYNCGKGEIGMVREMPAVRSLGVY